MVSSENWYRDTEPTSSSSSSSSSSPNRYLAADFQRLTNRRTSSPHFTPDSAHEALPAECPKVGRTVTTADKRSIESSPVTIPLRSAPASRQSGAIRTGSRSSVKEKEGGKRLAPLCLTHIITYSLPKHPFSDIQNEVRYRSILPRVGQHLRRRPTRGRP